VHQYVANEKVLKCYYKSILVNI